jgi:Signal transduction histidine kinase
MRLRWKLFAAQLATLALVLAAVLLSVRLVAISAVYNHMESMATGTVAHMTLDLRHAVISGINEAMVVGTLGAMIGALVASFGAASILTRPLRGAAEAAEQIASGDYSQRVNYTRRDEIGEFAAAFNNMAEQLEETEALRRELLATISHELRTPLTNIQGYLEGLLEGVIPEGPGTYQLLHGEAVRLSRLVGNIDRLSRLEAGIELVEPRSVATREAVRRAVDGITPRFEQKGVTLTMESTEPLLPVWADPDKLSQVLGNLLTNSLVYTPRDGEATVSVTGSEGRVHFAVKDTGIGIPANDLPHIFERFYRVDRSRSSTTGGAGIGLAVVRELVTRMGGAVAAESVLGEGTTMSFWLKSVEKAVAERKGRERPASTTID